MTNITSSNITLQNPPLSPLSVDFLLSHYNFSTLLPENVSSPLQERRSHSPLAASILNNFLSGETFFNPQKNKLGWFSYADLSKLSSFPIDLTVFFASDIHGLLRDWLIEHPEHDQIVRLIKESIECQRTILNLSGQKLKVLDAKLIKILSHLTWITILKLDSNELEEIPQNAFANMRQLTTLFLSHNNLTHLHPDLFNSLTNLTTLYLSYNKLTVLPETLFDKLPHLFLLFLEGNPFISLSPQLFENLTSHAAVHFDANLDPNFYFSLPSHIDVYACGFHRTNIAGDSN